MEEMISIKDYAQSRGVNYEAVRRQVKQFKTEDKEFKSHIQESKQRGVSTLLDFYAIEYLDKHRLPRPVIVRASTDETQQELERLRNELAKAMNELNSAKDTIINLTNEKLSLTEEKFKAIEDKTRFETILGQTERDLAEYKLIRDNLNQELALKDKEISSYKKTVFGLYKKVNT